MPWQMEQNKQLFLKLPTHTVDLAQEQKATAIMLDHKVQYAAWGHTTPLYQANKVI